MANVSTLFGKSYNMSVEAGAPHCLGRQRASFSTTLILGWTGWTGWTDIGKSGTSRVQPNIPTLDRVDSPDGLRPRHPHNGLERFGALTVGLS